MNVSSPVLLIHGLADTMVPVEHSRRLFKACRANKLLVTPKDMDHNSHLFDDPTFFALPVIQFFQLPTYYGEAPKLPDEVFKPPASNGALAGRGCTTASLICGGLHDRGGGAEAPTDDISVPSGLAAPAGQVQVNSQDAIEKWRAMSGVQLSEHRDLDPEALLSPLTEKIRARNSYGAERSDTLSSRTSAKDNVANENVRIKASVNSAGCKRLVL